MFEEGHDVDAKQECDSEGLVLGLTDPVREHANGFLERERFRELGRALVVPRDTVGQGVVENRPERAEFLFYLHVLLGEERREGVSANFFVPKLCV